MFDLPDALFIGSLLFHFVFPETLFYCGVPVRFCMRVEDPDIHKGAFESSSPKTVGGNIQPSAVSSVGSSLGQFLCGDSLNAYIIADFTQQCGS